MLEEIRSDNSDSDSDSESDDNDDDSATDNSGAKNKSDPIARALNPDVEKPSIQMVDDDEEEGEEADEKMLATILETSKRHGKGPRGRPSIVEVSETACTPTPEKQIERG